MPKENVHWTIARRTAKRLTQSAFHAALGKNMSACLLGAVFHDILFFATRSKTGTRLAHRLHGAAGEDTYSLLRLQAEFARNHDPAIANLRRSALVGLASHLAADVTLHPMVFFLSGRGGSVATQRHRALESAMDLAVAGGLAVVRRRSLARLVNELMKFLDARSRAEMLQAIFPLDGLATFFSTPKSEVIKAYDAGLRLFLFMQGLYRRPILARCLHSMLPVLPDKFREVEALFYAPQRQKTLSWLNDPLRYQHPVTGEVFNESLESLLDKAVDQAVDLCRRLEPAVFGGEPPLPHEYGPSLETGLPQMNMERMKHFKPAVWIE